MTVFGLSLSHFPAAMLSPSNGETTFLKAKNYETVQEKRRDAGKGSRGAPVPSNRIMLIVIAHGGNSRPLEWYSEGAVPPISCL